MARAAFGGAATKIVLLVVLVLVIENGEFEDEDEDDRICAGYENSESGFGGRVFMELYFSEDSTESRARCQPKATNYECTEFRLSSRRSNRSRRVVLRLWLQPEGGSAARTDAGKTSICPAGDGFG